MYCVDGFVHVLYILHISIMHCGFESAITGSIAKGNLKKHIRAITTNFRQSTYSISTPIHSRRRQSSSSLQSINSKAEIYSLKPLTTMQGWLKISAASLPGLQRTIEKPTGLDRVQGLDGVRACADRFTGIFSFRLINCIILLLHMAINLFTHSNTMTKVKLSCWTVNSMMCFKGKCNHTLLSTKSKPSAQNLVDFSSWLPLKVCLSLRLSEKAFRTLEGITSTHLPL